MQKRSIITFIISFFLTLFSLCHYPEEYAAVQTENEEQYTGIEIYIAKHDLYVNDEITASLLLILSSGKKTLLDNGEVLWKSSDEEILSVNESGLITGLTHGNASIIASIYDFETQEEIQVRDYSKILLSEIFYDAEDSDDGKEFIEIYNAHEYDCDISSFSIIDGSTSSSAFIFPEGSMVRANGFSIIAESDDGFYDMFGFSPSFFDIQFTLNNSGETVLLYRPDGYLNDYVFIEGGSNEYPSNEDNWGLSYELPSAPAGNTVQRINSDDTDTFEDWISGTPTPGE